MIATNPGVKKVPMTYRVSGKTRSAEIPGSCTCRIELPRPAKTEKCGVLGHPIAPDKLAMAVGGAGAPADHGMRWDNSGKNGHYADKLVQPYRSPSCA
jgi:hypothetical protein